MTIGKESGHATPNQLAKWIVDRSTSDTPEPEAVAAPVSPHRLVQVYGRNRPGWTLSLFEGSFMLKTVARGMDLPKVLSIGDKSRLHKFALSFRLSGEQKAQACAEA